MNSKYMPINLGTPIHRRRFLQSGGGLAALAFDQLLSNNILAATNKPLIPTSPNYLGKAKSVIWFFTNGGPSHVDTWDYKPELDKRDGEELPGLDKKTGFFVDQVGPLMRSPFNWKQYGQSGTWVPEIFPNLAKHVDDMAFIHSMHTETNNHSPALFQINTGASRMGLPCVGSWIVYGLGSESSNLPAFLVMVDTLGRGLPKGHASNWSSGFLPGVYQGTTLNTQGAPIDNLSPASGLTTADQRRQLDFLGRLNQAHLADHQNNAELAARMESFELAFRMQSAAPEAFDLSKESKSTHHMYGTENPRCGHVARQTLAARRLVERGVRFIQIYSGGMENERSWDGHSDIASNHRQFAGETDQPVAALLTDLKNRGLLDSTLVIWGGEFGRLPVAQRSKNTQAKGRDHNPHAFTIWMAGGGTKGGVHHGETDAFGHKAEHDKVSINDFHATLLHLLGIDHTKLTFRYSGRQFRLTDVAGVVIKPIIA